MKIIKIGFDYEGNFYKPGLELKGDLEFLAKKFPENVKEVGIPVVEDIVEEEFPEDIVEEEVVEEKPKPRKGKGRK